MKVQMLKLAAELEQCPLCPWPGSKLSFVAGVALQGHERDAIVAALRLAAQADAHGEPQTPTAPDGDPRIVEAYNAFRRGCSPVPPRWGELETWHRDAMRVSYLQGKLDAASVSRPHRGGGA